MAIRIPLHFPPYGKKKRKRSGRVFQSVQIVRFWHEILAVIQQQVVDIGQFNRPLASMKVPYRQLHFPDMLFSILDFFIIFRPVLHSVGSV